MKTLIFAVVFTAVIATLFLVQRPLPMPVAAAAAAAATPVGTVREIMAGIVDPTSKVVFDAVAVAVTDAGPVETAPKDDEAWAAVAHNALSLAEAGNLLKVPSRHVAAAEDMEKADPNDPSALKPSEIADKIAKDPATWAKSAEALTASAVEAWKFAKAHDSEGLFKVSEAIDNACESCHLKYWYPKQVIPALPKS